MRSINMNLILIIGLASLMHQTFGANILVVFPHIYYSHFRETSTLVRELNLRGHNVTFVSPFPNEVPSHENLTEVSIQDIIGPIEDFRNEYFKNHYHYNCYWSKLKYTSHLGYRYSKLILENINIKNLINSDSVFDLVIIEDVAADALAALSYVFNCPLVVLLSEPASLFYENYLSDIAHWKQYNELGNAHYWVIKELYQIFTTLPNQNELVKDLLRDYTDLRSIMYQTSLILVPSYATVGNLAAKYPNVKQIGGFNLKNFTRTMPDRLEKWFDESSQNFTVISNNFPDSVGEALQTFLFYSEDMMKNELFFTSEVSKVLGHPKVRLLIGDGDVYDTALALANRVPIITLSNNHWNQQFLTDALVEKNLVLRGSLKKLESGEFQDMAAFKTLHYERFRDQLTVPSYIIKSDANNSMEEAMFWIEYTLKYDNLSYLKSSNNLEEVVTRHLIVLIIVLAIVDIALFMLFYYIIKHSHKLILFCTKKISKSCGKYPNKSNISYIKL